MPFKYEIYKTQRVCLVRFGRKITGAPDAEFPDIDDRGCFRPTIFTGLDRGPVACLSSKDEIYVRVLRERIDTKAPLFITSSDESVMTVNNKTQLPDSSSIAVGIYGVRGNETSLPNVAKLRIHYGSATGVVIGELSVWVFSKLPVNLTPHRVTAQDAAGNKGISKVDIGAVIRMAESIWKPYGITFRVSPTVETSVTTATAGQVLGTELEKLFTTNFAAGTINAYFVDQTDSRVLGYGASRALLSTYGLTNPGILLADRTTETVDGKSVVSDRHTDIYSFANTVAHEIGHFLQLDHVDNREPDSTSASAAVRNNFRDDTWSRRNLMHNFNRSSFTDTPPPGSPVEVGYGIHTASGQGYRGSLITLKKLNDKNNSANHITDPQYLKARMAANSGSAVY